MPDKNSLFERNTKTATEKIERFDRLKYIAVGADNFKGSYQKIIVFDDGTENVVGDYPVDRSIDTFKDDGVDFNGVNITLSDFISIGAMLAEKWRALDEQARAKDAADASAAAVAAVVP